MKFSIKLLKIQLVDIIILLLSVMCLSAGSVVHKFRPLAIILLALVLLVGGMFKRLSYEKDFLYWLVWLLIMAGTSFLSYAMNSSWKYIGIYFCGILLANYRFSVEKQEMILKIFKTVCLIIAISAILAFLIPPFMPTLWFTVGFNKGSVLDFIAREQLVIKAFAGFGGERSETAFLMSVGIATILSEKTIAKEKKQKWIDNIMLFAMFLALLLTGKRTLLLITVLLFVLWFFMSGRAKDKIKYLFIGIFALVLLLSLVRFFPVIQHTLERFVISEGEDVTNGRGELWSYAFSMFSERPFLGGGLGSYNEYAYQNGYLYKGGKWLYHCHNVYIQAIGEMGLFGFFMWIFLLIKAFINTIMSYRMCNQDRYKRIFLFSIFMQCIILIYSLTGNCLYYDNQNMLYFVSIGLMYSTRRIIRTEKA